MSALALVFAAVLILLWSTAQRILVDELSALPVVLAKLLVRRYAALLHAGDRERYEEEWLAEIADAGDRRLSAVWFAWELRKAVPGLRTETAVGATRSQPLELIENGPIVVWYSADNGKHLTGRLRPHGALLVEHIREGEPWAELYPDGSGTVFEVIKTHAPENRAVRVVHNRPYDPVRDLELVREATVWDEPGDRPTL